MSPFQRTGYKIKPNHSGALPRYILSINVERKREQTSVSGRQFTNTFASACIASGRLVTRQLASRKVAHFDDRDALWEFIYSQTKSNYTVWLVGHNVLTSLIMCGLPHRFQCGELSIDKPRSKRSNNNDDTQEANKQTLAVLEEPPTIVGCRVGSTQGRIVIVDTRNWFPDRVSTSDATTGFDAAGQDTVCDSDNGRSADSESKAVCNLLVFEKLIQWVKDNDMGLFRYTASSQAMGAYRHRFMEHKIYVHDNLGIQRLERQGYYGGRSDVFKLGPFDDTVYQLDVNALFPSVMSSGYFPFFLSRYEQRPVLLELLPSIDWSASVAYVELKTDKPLYPLRTDLHVIYPVGSFATVLSGQELHNAFRAGHIVRCGSWAEYKLKPLFTKWVDSLWAMRQQYETSGDPIYAKFTKRIMNSLYGKFAQLTPNWENVTNDYSMAPFTTESRWDCVSANWTTYRSVGWQVQRKAERKERTGSFYAIAGFITSAARARMDYLRYVAGGRHVLYQGVDSLMVNKTGYQNLKDADEIHPSQLGKMRVEHESNYGVIRGISDYQIGSKIVLSSRALNTETTDQGEVLQHRYYVMEHLFRNGPIDSIDERLEEWHRVNSYKKGQVDAAGLVSPLVLGTKAMSASVGS
jgi:hypothetical protein